MNSTELIDSRILEIHDKSYRTAGFREKVAITNPWHSFSIMNGTMDMSKYRSVRLLIFHSCCRAIDSEITSSLG